MSCTDLYSGVGLTCLRRTTTILWQTHGRIDTWWQHISR